jgi:hypothetical protein
MNVPEVFSNSSAIRIDFVFANRKYTITGKSEVSDKKIRIRLRHTDDNFPCIELIYHNYPGQNIFEVMGIASKDYDNDGISKTLTCLSPSLPNKGALELLVMTALGIAKYIDSSARVFIDDKATLDGTSLSWLKYFDKYETTYSKYGFIIRGDSGDDSFSYPIFENFMKIQLRDVLRMKLKDIYPETILNKIKESYEKINKKLSINQTLEKTIKTFIQANKTGPITKYLDKGKYDFINLEGIWELSWYYYNNNISEEKKIKQLKITQI